jgi:hypothetical protein
MKQHAVTVFHRPPERLNCAQAVLDAELLQQCSVALPASSFQQALQPENPK